MTGPYRSWCISGRRFAVWEMPYFTIEFISICHKENNKGRLRQKTPAQILSLRTRCLLWKHLAGVSVSLLLRVCCLTDSLGFHSACAWSVSQECAWCQESKRGELGILEDWPLSDVPTAPTRRAGPRALGLVRTLPMRQEWPKAVKSVSNCRWI